MKNKKMLAIAAVAALSISAAGYGIASAYGGGRMHHGHGGGLFLLAKAAGISHEQIHDAFKGESTTLKGDFAAVKTARTALATCLAAGGSTCSTQATTYLTAKGTLEKDKLGVWQNLFAQDNTNPKNATAVLNELQQLQASRKQIFQQAFGKTSQPDATNSDTTTPTE